MENKKTLLFIHGFGSNKNFWIPIKKMQRDYDMHALTLKLTDDASVLNFSKQVIDYIEQKQLKDIIVVGHSLGCSVAFMLVHHTSVKKLILLSPHNAFIENESDTRKWVIPETIEESIESFENLVYDQSIWKSPIDKMANNYLQFVNEQRKALTNLFETSLFNTEFKNKLIDAYQNTNIPVSIITGDADCFVSIESVEELKTYGFNVEVLNNVGHAILTESAIAVNEFINKQIGE